MYKGKLLAIDYGAQKIGLAVSDADQQMAFGRGVLLNKNIEQVCADLHKLIIEERVVKVLVGLPTAQDGGDTVQTARIRGFVAQLGNFLNSQGLKLMIEFIDESFSSFEANKMLQELGVPGRDRKKTEDELAAIVLVHRYIDFRP